MVGRGLSRSSDFGLQDGAIIGEIPVVSKLRLGSERLRLFLTNNGLIVAHIGKRGAGALATASLFGRMGTALEEFFKGGKESLKRLKREQLTPDAVLAADEDNFHVSYSDIISIELSDMPDGVSLTVLTRDDKFQFTTTVRFDTVLSVLQQGVPDKVVVRRLSKG